MQEKSACLIVVSTERLQYDSDYCSFVKLLAFVGD